MMKWHIFLFGTAILGIHILAGVYSLNYITVQRGAVQVKQGHNISLWCELKYVPKRVVPVHWQSPPTFKTRTLDCDCYESAKDKYAMSCSDTTDPFAFYNMTIMDVEWADNGIYRCLHANDMDIVDLQVLVPVTEVTLEKVVNSTAAEPQHLYQNFTCTTNCASPAPKISWFVNDQPFHNNVSVTELGCSGAKKGQKRTESRVTVISTVMDKERKEYNISCTAENVIGEPKVSKAITVNNNALTGIYSRTDITVQPGPVKVIQGHSVSLWCKLKYDPDNVLPVFWQSPPNFKTRTVDCYSFLKDKYVMSCSDINDDVEYYNMTIMDVQWADNGEYRCLYTKHMDIVDLQVLVPVTDVTLEKFVHNSAAEPQRWDQYFTCTTNCASPAPKISWFVKDQPFGETMVIELDCLGAKKGQKRTTSTVMIVMSADMDKESTEYDITCMAENVLGEPKVSKAITVNNDVNPGPPQPKIVEVASTAATIALSPWLVTAVIIIAVLEKYCQQLIRVNSRKARSYTQCSDPNIVVKHSSSDGESDILAGGDPFIQSRGVLTVAVQPVETNPQLL
ncbi:neural cell adhesion molecule 1-A-like [Lineus longissimus]|uniref:neural cell adhesion molecule 1-A-like n=1 Tax=Lineus longissimus TaxID=88925 RepID=UPI00315DF771